MKWHFQFTQHDEHDYDATQVPVMANVDGKELILQANRNGFFLCDRPTNGRLIRAGIVCEGIVTKEKKMLPGATGPAKRRIAHPEGNRGVSGAAGATNWMSPTYDPQTKFILCKRRGNSAYVFHARTTPRTRVLRSAYRVPRYAARDRKHIALSRALHK